jgi:hypothetical protein
VKHVFKTKRSANPKFEQDWEAHKSLEHFTKTMSKNLHAYRDAMKIAHDAAKLVITEAQQWILDPAVQRNSPSMIPMITTLKDCQQQCELADTKSISFFNKCVLAPVDVFCRRMDGVHRLVKELEERHSRFDYYNDKLEQLQRAKAVRAEKGKKDSDKDSDKFLRNKQKLNTAHADFDDQTKKVCTELLEISQRNKFEVFDPALTRLTEFQIMSTKLRYEQTERLRPSLQDPASSEVDSDMPQHTYCHGSFISAYDAVDMRIAGVKFEVERQLGGSSPRSPQVLDQEERRTGSLPQSPQVPVHEGWGTGSLPRSPQVPELEGWGTNTTPTRIDMPSRFASGSPTSRDAEVVTTKEQAPLSREAVVDAIRNTAPTKAMIRNTAPTKAMPHRAITARAQGTPSSAALLRHELAWKSFGRDSIALSADGLLATKVVQESWDLITSGQSLRHGRHYWEIEIVGADMGRFFVGVARPNLDHHGDYALMECTDAWFIHAGDGSLWGNGKYADDAAGSCEQGDRVGVLLDLDGGSLLFFRNGEKHGAGFPAGSVTGPVSHALQIGDLNESGRLLPLAKWPVGHAWKANDTITSAIVSPWSTSRQSAEHSRAVHSAPSRGSVFVTSAQPGSSFLRGAAGGNAGAGGSAGAAALSGQKPASHRAGNSGGSAVEQGGRARSTKPHAADGLI